MDTCIKIFEPASPLLHRRSLAVAFAVLLCQPMVAGAQPSSASLASQAELGTRTAPPSPDMTIPEPAMRAPAAATDSPEAPLNNAHANFAPNDPPGEWRRQARDYANTRYSPLDQITAANVARLRVAWSFSDGTPYGHEAAPLVVGDTMYIVTPFPNHCLRARPDQGRRTDQVDVRPESDAIGDRQGLLRHRQPRQRLRRRQADLQPARRPHDRDRREDGQGSLAHEDGRRRPPA